MGDYSSILRDTLLINGAISTLYVLTLLYLDKYEREPIRNVAVLYGSAIVATAVFGVAKQLLWSGQELSPLAAAYIEAGLFEEMLKFTLLAIVLWRWRRWIDERYDCILYLGIIALGFSIEEDVGYYFNATLQDFVTAHATGEFGDYNARLAEIALARSFPGHVLFDALGGAVVARGLRRRRLPLFLLCGLGVAVLLHGTWNYIASVAGLGGIVLYMLGLLCASIAVIRQLLRSSRYWEEQRRWRQRVRDTREEWVAAMRNQVWGSAGERREEVQGLLAVLQEIERGLRRLPLLPGTDQAAIFRRLEESFPGSSSIPSEQAVYEIEVGLESVRRDLRAFRWGGRGWLYWFGLAMIFLILGVVVTGATVGVRVLLS